MAASDAVQTPMVRDHCATELGDVVLEVHEVLALLVTDHVVEMDVLVTPLEVVDDSFVSKFLFDDEQILEEVDNSFIDVEVVKLGNHSLLVLEVLLKLVNKCVALVNHAANVVKNLGICILLELCEGIVQSLIFALLPLQLVVHRLDLGVVALELTHNHLFVNAMLEPVFDVFEEVDDLRQLFGVSLLRLGLLEQLGGLFPQLVNLAVEGYQHGLQVGLGHLVDVHHVVVAVLADCAAEADSAGAVFAEALDGFKAVLDASVGWRWNALTSFNHKFN